VDMNKQRSKQMQFMMFAFGGPNEYKVGAHLLAPTTCRHLLPKAACQQCLCRTRWLLCLRHICRLMYPHGCCWCWHRT
jgi:truncated hemoglobin YjbI